MGWKKGVSGLVSGELTVGSEQFVTLEYFPSRRNLFYHLKSKFFVIVAACNIGDFRFELNFNV